MNMTGRRRDSIWSKFSVSESEGKKCLRAKCLKCKTEVVGLVARLKKHYASCVLEEISEVASVSTSNIRGVSEQSENILEENTDSDGQEESSGNKYTDTRESLKKRRKVDEKLFHSTAMPSASVTVNTMEKFLVRTDADYKSKLDIQVSKYFYSTNTPFLHADHREFKKMIEMLRPGYNPPSRRQIGGDLLEEVYGNVMSDMKRELKGKNVCMALDGWSNVHNESVVCISVTDVLERNVYLISTIDTADNSHTGDYLLQLSVEAIKQCQEFKCKVTSFVTDNASNMTNMRSQLSQQRDLGDNADVITYGCSAHILNLLAHDIEVPGVMEHVKQIIKYFRNHHFPAAKYKQAGGKMLILPHDVRWNTAADSIESYLDNWHILSRVCSENRISIDANIISKVNNVTIKVNAQDYLVKLKKIAVALDKIQSDFCILSEATRIWLLLLEEFKATSINDDDQDVSLCKKRFEMAMSSVHFLSYLLDPRYEGEKLSNDQLESAMEYVDN